MALDLQPSIEIKKEALQAIEVIARVAATLEMKDSEEAVRTRGRQLMEDSFRIMVAGRFRNGKSTLLNALLGKPTAPVAGLPTGKGPMPVTFVPTTAVLTSVTYSEKPYVRMWTFDGKQEEWSLERYLRDARVKPDDEENQKFFANIREFEMGFPAEICKQGVTIIDSPGTDDTPQRSAITNAAAKTCDAAIVVFRNDVLAGGTEREFVEQVLSVDGTYNFTVVNRFHGKEPDEEFKAFAWSRIVKLMRGGPSYSGQDFASQDIYFVDAQAAHDGILEGNRHKVQQSGLELLEKRLGEYLTTERHRQHIERFIKGALRLTLPIEEQIQRRSIALKTEQEKLLRAYEEARPGLEKVRARVARLPEIFATHRRRAGSRVVDSFDRLMLKIDLDLPELMKDVKLPSDGGLTTLFKQKQMVKEAFEAAQKIITDQVNVWANGDEGGLQTILTSVVEDLTREVKDEVAEMEQAYRKFYVDIGGPDLGTGDSSTYISWFERGAWVAAGALMGSPTLALTGGALGWKGAAATVGGAVGAALTVSLLGLSTFMLFPLALILALAGQWLVKELWLAAGIKQSVVEKIRQGEPTADPPRPALRQWPAEATPKLVRSIDEEFSKLEKAFTASITTIIEEEQRNLEAIIENSRRAASAKTKLLEGLEILTSDLNRAKKNLESASVLVKQAEA